MLLIIGTIRLPAEKLNAARPAMQKMIEASRTEDGCIEYTYSQDILEPNLIHVKELWRDRVSLDKHFVSDHIGKWRSEWPKLGITDRNLVLYDVDAPKLT
ncbi:putative quinol monooxygenase [Ochrobactrum sp. Marseille-Q0166]|uniref:putative quinol monooxygenase n=1 Tax=Ochrobactrum sp. Marseille-Q0166 TaxID=2761105 RepID=UPI001655AD24|nr:putative quinol monooxygenase [Ochrobactrum sp. Marseille-Q0166]MBC8718001.1 antibiotic biosynthesis monooxygenase [Ochrobactrum sp. Marseille-Q0166]